MLIYLQIVMFEGEKEVFGEELFLVCEIIVILGKLYDLLLKFLGDVMMIGIVGMFRVFYFQCWKLGFDVKQLFDLGIIVGVYVCVFIVIKGFLIFEISFDLVWLLVGV